MTVDDTAKKLDYQVRINRRARRPQIKVTHTGQVVVVLPCRLAEHRIECLVRQHRSWIDARLGELASRVARLPEQLGLTPQRIVLQAIGEQWKLRYGAGIGRPWREDPARQELLLQSTAEDETVRQVLQRWLHRQARRVLPEWLAKVSDASGMSYAGVTIRAQKTRWGSCSATGNINLNRNLLFLPPALVEYLLLHELCHTRHPNHSAEYWALVARHQPQYRQHDRALRNAVSEIPLWAQPQAC